MQLTTDREVQALLDSFAFAVALPTIGRTRDLQHGGVRRAATCRSETLGPLG
jgi:hypothetical protein